VIARGVWLLAAAGIAFGGTAAREKKFFDERVAPILTKSCLGCHNHELDDGGISFEDRAALLSDRGGKGPVIVPGKPGESPLVRAIRHDGDVRMPPGKKLPERDIAILTEWIKRGAEWGTKLRPAGSLP
jgi:cytochrome c